MALGVLGVSGLLLVTLAGACAQDAPAPGRNLNPGPSGSHSYVGQARPGGFCARLQFELLRFGKPSATIEKVDDTGAMARCDWVEGGTSHGKIVNVYGWIDGRPEDQAAIAASPNLPSLEVFGATRAAWNYNAESGKLVAQIEDGPMFLHFQVLFVDLPATDDVDVAAIREFLLSAMDELRAQGNKRF